MDNFTIMEIERSTKHRYFLFGIFYFLIGLLEMGLFISIVSLILLGIFNLYTIFHTIPLFNNISLSDFYQNSDVPLPTVILFFSTLLLLFVVLPLTSLALSFLCFFEGLLLIWIAQKTFIKISPEGIVFHSPGVELRSIWKNIKGAVHKSYWGGLRHFDVLTLIEPAQPTLARWVLFGGRKPTLEIPLSVFPDWRERELGQAAKQYAPWIMENERPSIPKDAG